MAITPAIIAAEDEAKRLSEPVGGLKIHIDFVDQSVV
jgi:hypothetical protein